MLEKHQTPLQPRAMAWLKPNLFGSCFALGSEDQAAASNTAALGPVKNV